MRLIPIILAFLSFTASSTTIYTSQTPLLAPIIIQDKTLADYLVKLSNCESGGSWTALNPKDLDGTPSKGKFQFKESTFNEFSALYGIATTSIWNGNEQQEIVTEMAQTLTKKQWHNQFPDCTDKYGYPPTMVD